MNFFAKLRSFTNLSVGEVTLIEFIEQDPIAFLKMDATAIGKACFVSKSTLYRLCQKLECSGLTALKMMISASYSDKNQNESKIIDRHRPFSPHDSPFTIVSNLRDLYEQSLNLVVSHLDMNDLRSIADELNAAASIVIFVDDHKYHIANAFKERMERIGARVSVPTNDYMKIAAAQTTRPNDVVLYASYTPSHSKHMEFVKIIKGNRSKLIVMSASHDNTLSNQGHRKLIVGPGDHDLNHIADFSDTVLFQFAFDCIYSVYFKKDYDRNVEKIHSTYLKFQNF